jgi:hypothetical protein
VSAGDQVAVPAQHGFRAHQQPDAAQHVARKAVQQGGEERSVGRCELRSLAAQLPFEDGELVAECQDLSVFGAVAHRDQLQHRKSVGDAEVCQSQEHRAILATA